MARQGLTSSIEQGLLSLNQVAKLIGVSRNVVERWVNKKVVESFIIPDTNERRINALSLYRFLLEDGYPTPSEVIDAAENYKRRFGNQAVE